MFKVISLLVFLAISCGLVSGSGLNLPSYIPKCSLTDPKLNECLKAKANEVIPILAKGDVYFHIPPLSPIVFSKAPLYGTGLTYVMFDTYSDDFKNIKITGANMDLQKKEASFDAVLDKMVITSKNYTIVDGKILDISASGHGRHNITLVGIKLNYRARFVLYTKHDEQYLEYADSTTSASVDRGHFYFENIHSSENSDVNAYIDENWKRFFVQIKPALDSYAHAFLSYPLKAITHLVPFKKLFLP